jgi:hypothetical protein
MYRFAVAEGEKTFMAMIVANTRWAYPAKWQIVLANMHKRIIDAYTAGMDLCAAALLQVFVMRK